MASDRPGDYLDSRARDLMPAPGLGRFIEAQEGVYAAVLGELVAGAKTSHWMWFVFPQLKGLGRSATARHYGLEDRAEAAAYWEHAVLGERLRRCTGLALAVQGKSAHAIFGSPDDLKLRSCMTLFAAVAPGEPVFRQVLEKYYDGQPDAATLALLESEA